MDWKKDFSFTGGKVKCKNCNCKVYINNSGILDHASNGSEWADYGCFKHQCKKPEIKARKK